MRRRVKKNNGRKFVDARPKPPGVHKGRKARKYSSSSVGGLVAGFDHYGYPIVKNRRLPSPFIYKISRGYNSTKDIIRPMRLVDAGSKPKPGIASVSSFRLKPSPSVPSAPSDLPSSFEFCIQKGEDGYFYRFRNPNTSLHGAEADVISCDPDDSGMIICTVVMPGSSETGRAPLCEEPGADKEPVPSDCCVKILGDGSGQVVCPGSAYDLLIVQIATFEQMGDIEIASILHPDLPGGGVRIPVCEPIEETPEERPCCIEESTGLVICPEGIDFPLNGKKIPLDFLVFATETDGSRVGRLKCGDIMEIDPSARAADPALEAMYHICDQLGGYIFLACEKAPPIINEKIPIEIPKLPPKVPDICCFDPQTGSLVCEGTRFHNLKVEVVAEAVVGGKPIVSVVSEDLPGGGARVPLCPPPAEIPKIPPRVDQPSLPAPPASGYETQEASRYREIWDEMVSKPAKMTKCDEKWLALVDKLKGRTLEPGRRFSSIRRYGMGIAPENLEHARFPGLRGGREDI